jgi:uncharacterized protein (DUF433 family)
MTDRIVINPDVCNGRPVVRGTRITVQTVLEFLAAGDSVEEVLEEYPSLTRADVQACLDYAARVMGNHFSVVRVFQSSPFPGPARIRQIRRSGNSRDRMNW